MDYMKALLGKQSNENSDGQKKKKVWFPIVHVQGMIISFQLTNGLVEIIEFLSVNNFDIIKMLPT